MVVAVENAEMSEPHAEMLAALIAKGREALERERAGFQARLHRRSDDYAATEGLRTVELALRLLPRDRNDSVRRAQR